MTTEREQILALAGEPVGSINKYHTTVKDDKPWCKEVLFYSAGNTYDRPENRVDLYTADQVLAATKPLEEEIERLKTVPMKYRRMAFNAQLQDENDKLRQQLAEKDEVIAEAGEMLAMRDKQLAAAQNVAEDGFRTLAEKDAEILVLKRDVQKLQKLKEEYGPAMMEVHKRQWLEADRESNLAAANAEIERLKEEVRVTKEEDFPRKVEAVANNWRNKLAAAQAREQQYREAIWVAAAQFAAKHMWDESVSMQEALAIPTDTSALEAMIAKAGEHMRRRAIDSIQGYAHWTENTKRIRALPGVTLGDLK